MDGNLPRSNEAADKPAHVMMTALDGNRGMFSADQAMRRHFQVDLRPFVCSACVVVNVLSPFTAAVAGNDPSSLAAGYCSDHMMSHNVNYDGQTTHISDDHTVLCFDGRIGRDFDLTILQKLRDHGLFVVRSQGGDIFTAMQMSDILWEKRATVVIRDYCLSACANALLIASDKSYVLPNTIVAWHGGLADCRDPEVVAALARVQMPCTIVDWAHRFYTRRDIDRRHTLGPQTPHTRRIFGTVLQSAANKRSVFWMWNPKNHGSHFRGKIVYRSYPDSQESVDAIVRRFLLYIRVVYDPEE